MSRFCLGFLERLTLLGVCGLAGFAAGCSSHTSPSQAAPAPQPISLNPVSRDLEPPSKLAPALEQLAAASDVSRDLAPANDGSVYVPPSSEVGYSVPGTTDVFEVAIHITPDADINAITTAGAYIQLRVANTLYATVHAHDLRQIADVTGVTDIEPLPADAIPTPPKSHLQSSPAQDVPRDVTDATGDSEKFDPKGLTGKGVVVGVVDTGIDWRHPDFIDANGNSRILYLWDLFDNTWTKYNHTIGSAPPYNWDDGKPAGTLYTNEQINAALHGQLNIASTDAMGHGTACAGTAAGNGLGIAPQADLIIVNSNDPSKGLENAGTGDTLAVPWIKSIADQRHEPCVITLSYGGPEALHDGTGEQEDCFNQLLNSGGAPGAVICCSAGNDGEHSIHARGRFGPMRQHELENGFADPVEMVFTKETAVAALFDTRDDWRMRLWGVDKYLVAAKKGDPAFLDLAKLAGGGSRPDASVENISAADENDIKSRLDNNAIHVNVNWNQKGTDVLIVTLPPGQYWLMPGGNSENVANGVFDLYLPDAVDSSFGEGGDHQMVIGSPGDADNVITVGSYDFRGVWQSQDGGTVHDDQIDPGMISAYSSAGFRRDGVVKPDIAAPGQFMISAYADKCHLADDYTGKPNALEITQDGKHVAWAGTSASTPYTAGVVALMLQKNPQLTSKQVKQILRDTADHDLEKTGAVPNRQWGYGRLNPQRAIDEVPQSTGTPPGPAPVAPAPAPVAPAPAPVAPSPFAPAPSAGFSGTFKGDGITLVLTGNADGTFSGSLVNSSGQTFPLSAHLASGQLTGSATRGGTDYPFTATLDGDQLTLKSGDKTHVLARQAVPGGASENWRPRSAPQNRGRSQPRSEPQEG